jgi:hypothetical protein
MTFELERLILGAQRELVRPACEFDGHDWISEGGRGCPMGAEGCSQAVYVCRSCGVYDYGSGDDSPGKRDCQAVCGESMTGWQNGPLDPNPEPWLAGLGLAA